MALRRCLVISWIRSVEVMPEFVGAVSWRGRGEGEPWQGGRFKERWRVVGSRGFMSVSSDIREFSEPFTARNSPNQSNI
jgi:hypothetical protein